MWRCQPYYVFTSGSLQVLQMQTCLCETKFVHLQVTLAVCFLVSVLQHSQTEIFHKTRLVCTSHIYMKCSCQEKVLKVCVPTHLSESVQRRSRICQKCACPLFFKESAFNHYGGKRIRGAGDESFSINMSAYSINTLAAKQELPLITSTWGLQSCLRGCCMIMCRCHRFILQALLA